MSGKANYSTFGMIFIKQSVYAVREYDFLWCDSTTGNNFTRTAAPTLAPTFAPTPLTTTTAAMVFVHNSEAETSTLPGWVIGVIVGCGKERRKEHMLRVYIFF